MPGDWNFATCWEAIADATPDAPAVIQGAGACRGALRDRSARLAAPSSSRARPPRQGGMYLYNSPEYCEGEFAAMKIRAIPINVNYRYLDDELAYLIDNADGGARLPLVARRSRRAGARPRRRSCVRRRSTTARPRLDGRRRYERPRRRSRRAARSRAPGDEIYMFYTGGTTGMPKGVMYSMQDFAGFFLPHLPVDDRPTDDPRSGRRCSGRRRSCAPRGDAMVSMSGAAAHARHRLLARHDGAADARRHGRHSSSGARSTRTSSGRPSQRERVNLLMVIVGDAFAKPLLRALDDATPGGRGTCRRLRLMVSSGDDVLARGEAGAARATSPVVSLVDVLGSTEGGMGQSTARPARAPRPRSSSSTRRPRSSPRTAARSCPAPARSACVAQRRHGAARLLQGSREVGAHVPRGERRALRVPRRHGDRRGRRHDHAARPRLNCINTGGEKVFPEEVEEALKVHPAVEDTLVFGVPDERFGQQVVGVASLAPAPRPPTEADPRRRARGRLASYKRPEAHSWSSTTCRAPRTASPTTPGPSSSPPNAPPDGRIHFGVNANRRRSRGSAAGWNTGGSRLLLLLASRDLGEHVAGAEDQESSPSIVISVPPYFE